MPNVLLTALMMCERGFKNSPLPSTRFDHVPRLKALMKPMSNRQLIAILFVSLFVSAAIWPRIIRVPSSPHPHDQIDGAEVATKASERWRSEGYLPRTPQGNFNVLKIELLAHVWQHSSRGLGWALVLDSSSESQHVGQQ
jgi:hypothetical protein